ncbi:ras-related protein Rab-12 [Erinaceus europaeus]|uniref:small monomeric GTPase n=1 Tax=Erinaceus europaeus TaxID=9365 RepID=A0ABM3Y6J0_ERIEU|nr:ras-related protein Rab-12 [Erinaceus europaeus]
MLLPLLRNSCFPPSSPGGGVDGGAQHRPAAQGPRERGGEPGPGAARGRGQPCARMDPGAALQGRGAAGGGLGPGSPALSGGQSRRRKQPPRPADFKLQVIIIGSRGVGKTSLMERFTDDTFCEACKSTVGVDFKIKTVELRGKKIRLQIWDTAGQERFNSITSAYYRSAKGIILVYDITKKETFDDLPKWMKMIDKYASEDAELLLVGNKLDCETDREITRQQGEKFAQQITGMRFCEASAKDNFNVDEIFLKLVDDILKKMPLEVLRSELSNSILSLQPEPEIPPELPPPRPHVRCC